MKAAIFSVNSFAENEMGSDGVKVCHHIIYINEILKAIKMFTRGLVKINDDMCL